MGYMFFLMDSYSTADCCISRPVSFDFWKYIVSKVLETATDFEIRCWPDEMCSFALGERYGTKINNTETKEVVYRGRTSKAFADEVLSDHLSENGTLKWFTLNLTVGANTIFHSGHYGTELVLYRIREEQKAEIQKWAESYPEIKWVDYFPEEV